MNPVGPLPAVALGQKSENSAVETSVFRQWLVQQWASAAPATEGEPAGVDAGAEASRAASGGNETKAGAPAKVSVASPNVATPDVASRDVASQDVATRATMQTAAVRAAPQASCPTEEKIVAAESGAEFAEEFPNSGAVAGSSGAAAGVDGRFPAARSGGKQETKPVPEKAAAAGSALELGTRAPAGQTEATMPAPAQVVPAVVTPAPNPPENAAGTEETLKTPQRTGENPVVLAAPPSMEKAVAVRDLPAHGREAQPRISGRAAGKVSAKITGFATKNYDAPVAVRPEGIVDGQKPAAAVQPFSCPMPEPRTITPAPEPMSATAARSTGEPARVPGSAERMAVPPETPGSAPRAAVRSNTTATEQHPAMAAEAPAPGQRVVAGAAVSSPAAMPAHGVQQLSSAPVSISLPARMSGGAARAAPPSPGVAFDRIDSGAAPQMLNRTPQRLEVGVHDPGLGWVEVRARAAEGQIAATLSTSSATHPAVAAQLPAMREYLAGQQVRVDTLNAQPFEAGSEGGRNASGNRNPNGNTPATSGEALPDLSGEAEPESLSWIDVRV